MANESIELLKNYAPEKMQWPAVHQEKIDGVPARVTRIEGKVVSLTRQNERLVSIPHIEKFCEGILQHEGDSVVMELHIEDTPFKDISGHVRRHEPCPELHGYIFDADWRAYTDGTYRDRMITLGTRLNIMHMEHAEDEFPVSIIPGILCEDQAAAEAAHAALMKEHPTAEGSVLHSVSKLFNPGKRCWGTQRMKPVPTIDLLVIGFKEAVSEDGKPLKMVGRVEAEFTKLVDGKPVTEPIGIGPGALTHAQRKALWAKWISGEYKPRIAEMKYMRDESYDALRQPTFKQWRPDKIKADVNVQGI